MIYERIMEFKKKGEKMGIFNKLSGKKKARAQKIEKAPEKKQLEGPALVGTNVLEPGPWKKWTPKPPVVYKLRNLVFWSLRIPGGEDMVIDWVGRHIYVCSDVLSICRLDFDGNPDGLLRLPCAPLNPPVLRISHDGKLLVSSGSWLYRVDPEGQVISAVEHLGRFDVLPDGTIVSVSGYGEVLGWWKTFLRFVRGEKVHEVDVSAVMAHGHMLRCSSDGFLYVVGAPPHTVCVANTVFKFDPAGNLVNSCSIFRQIGATCPTRDGGIDVLELDGDRLVRLSREMKIVYDSRLDLRPEAFLFRARKDRVLLLWKAHAIDTDDAGNCFVLAHDELMRFKRFWAEPSGREARVYSDDKGKLLKAKRDVEGLIKVQKNDTLKCKNCRFVNKEGSNFCENCGSRLS